MIDLRKDVYLRLVFAVRKNDKLSRSITNVKFDSWGNYSSKGLDDSSVFEKAIDNASVTQAIRSKLAKPIIKPASAEEKIDETVEKIISDPRIVEIKLELEVAERLLTKIKIIDAHNPKIPVLEKTITRLKAMLEQKSYV